MPGSGPLCRYGVLLIHKPELQSRKLKVKQLCCRHTNKLRTRNSHLHCISQYSFSDDSSLKKFNLGAGYRMDYKKGEI